MRPRLSDIAPPILTRAWRRSSRRHGLFGDFPNWAAALAASKPYETDLATYGQITDRVRRGEVASGRNLMPILTGLSLADGGRVLDFGGNLGMIYFEIARVVPDRISAWRVIDCKEVADYGSANFANDKLGFSTSLESAGENFSPNMVLCSHALQYLENPYEVLGALTAGRPSVVVLHELPLAERARFMIQRLPESLGGTERPIQILAAGKLATALSSYELISEMDLPTWDHFINARHVAQVYRRRERASRRESENT